MKRKKIIIAVATLMILMSTGVVYAFGQQPDGQGNGNTRGNGNGNGNVSQCVASPEATEVLADQQTQTRVLTEASSTELETTLVAAILDEYKAQAEYDALIDTFGAVKPLTNIIKAEAYHIDALEVLFDAYGFSIPEDNSAKSVAVPDTLAEAFQTGVDAEINNIAMYKDFLKQDLPQDVADTFTNLMNASENHLAAFERQVDRF